MTQQAMHAFLEATKSDTTKAETLRQVLETSSAQAMPDAVAEHACALGFDVTPDDLGEAFRRGQGGQAEGELSDEDLEAVAGGGGGLTTLNEDIQKWLFNLF